MLAQIVFELNLQLQTCVFLLRIKNLHHLMSFYQKSCMGHCAINEAMGTIQHQLIGQLKGVNFKILAQREQAIGAGSLSFLQVR